MESQTKRKRLRIRKLTKSEGKKILVFRDIYMNKDLCNKLLSTENVIKLLCSLHTYFLSQMLSHVSYSLTRKADF